MAEIKKAHVFETGTWNGIEITGAILDSLVQSFQAMANAGKIPLKLGHNDEQKVTDGQPAIGWVSNLWREGTSLFATFTGMPAVVMDAIKAKLYKFVSIEMLLDVEWNGSRWPAVLDAVALLGADRPAVTALKELEGLTAMSRQLSAMRVGARAAFTQADPFPNYGERKAMDEAQIKAAIDAALAPVKAEATQLREQFTVQGTKLKDAETENARLKAQLEETRKRERDQKIAANKERFKKLADVQVRAGKVTPAKRDEFTAKYLKDEAAYESLDFDLVEIVFGKPEDPKVNDNRSRFSSPDATAIEQRAEELNKERRKRVREYQAAHPGADIFQANAAVMRADPDLALDFKQHLLQTGHVRGQPIAAFAS